MREGDHRLLLPLAELDARRGPRLNVRRVDAATADAARPQGLQNPLRQSFLSIQPAKEAAGPVVYTSFVGNGSSQKPGSAQHLNVEYVSNCMHTSAQGLHPEHMACNG